MIKVKVIGDSYYYDQHEDPHRVTTFELEYPRYIHSELGTHRVFSRNSASSRAIPIEKMIDLIYEDTAVPEWTLNQKGMIGKEMDNQITALKARNVWFEARDDAVRAVRKLIELGIHKQNANRLLEPFQHIKTILTGTDFDNFFKLRISPEAQPEIRQLATMMRDERDESVPWELKENEVHCPFFEHVKVSDVKTVLKAVALCAQVSYRKEDGKEDTVRRIINQLLKGERIHASPFEHICIPDFEYTAGNLNCFTQLRHCIERWKKYGNLPDEPDYYDCISGLGKRIWQY